MNGLFLNKKKSFYYYKKINYDKVLNMNIKKKYLNCNRLHHFGTVDQCHSVW